MSRDVEERLERVAGMRMRLLSSMTPDERREYYVERWTRGVTRAAEMPATTLGMNRPGSETTAVQQKRTADPTRCCTSYLGAGQRLDVARSRDEFEVYVTWLADYLYRPTHEKSHSGHERNSAGTVHCSSRFWVHVHG